MSREETVRALRFKAEQCRLEARSFVGPHAREMMLRVADTYDAVAERWEEIQPCES